MKWHFIFGVIVLGILGFSLLPAKAIDTSGNGRYISGKWKYEYQITSVGTGSERRVGKLTYDDKDVQILTKAQLHDQIETPWGRRQYYGTRGYFSGWLAKLNHDKPIKLDASKLFPPPDDSAVGAAEKATPIDLEPSIKTIVAGFEVVAPRPMAEAVMILSEQLNCVITYEDPIFQYTNELREVYPGLNIFVPKVGKISYTYENVKTESDIILGLINQHYGKENVGYFTLVKTGEIYNVFPIRYRNRDGQSINHSSPLETRITHSLKNTNCFDALNKLCLTVSQSNNDYQIKLSSRAINVLINTPFSRDITQEPARNVLNEILNTVNEKRINIHEPLTWQLTFDPQRNEPETPHTYYLDFLALSPTNASFMRLRICDQRPMAIAAKALEKKFGKTISYEDPPYVCDCDVMGNSTGKSLAGGIIDISWESGDNIDDVLRLLTETPIRPRANPEIFKFSKSEGKYYIYPYKSKDKQGNLVSRTPIMNTTFSFNAQNVKGAALFESICTKLSDLTKENIVLGAVPEKTLSDVLVTKVFPSISITNQKANVALNRLLGEISPEISWQLLFNPTLEQYELMLHNK